MFKDSKFILIILLVLELVMVGIIQGAPNTSVSVSSPNGKVGVNFVLKDGFLYYNISYDDTLIIQDSSLGFHFKNAKPLDGDFKIMELERKTIDKIWEPVWGTKDKIRDQYNQLVLKLEEEKAPYRKMNVVFRAYNDGIGFRYILPKQENLKYFEIISEDTQFQFTGNYIAWWQPGSYDSYYEETHKETSLKDINSMVNMPMTIKVDKNLYICVTEAALTNYADAKLSPIANEDYSFKIDLVPWPDGVIKVKASTPHLTPWRTIIIGNRPGALIESNLIVNLNEPCALKDTSWIKPGKLTGVWWGFHTRRYNRWSATTEEVKKYIDFASRHGIHKLIVEGWTAQGWGDWDKQNYTTPSIFLNLKEVLEYGRKRDVRLLMWMETGGNYKNLEKQFDNALELYEKWGAFGIMVGWAGSTAPHNHHDQFMVNLYHKIIKKAAKHHLTVIIHEAYKPTGFCRTYPNWVSSEGVQGMEHSAWSFNNTAQNQVILPFTRMVAGPMNYTPGVFEPEIKGSFFRVESTIAKQLAIYVVYFDPQQRVVDFPENCEAAPSFEFVEYVPTIWDDTRVLNGEIGDYVTIARRSGNEWYVGSMTDENARVLEVPLDFLASGKYVAQIYADAPDAHYINNPKPVTINKVIVDGSDKIVASLAPGGGQAIRIIPATEEDIKNLPQYTKN